MVSWFGTAFARIQTIDIIEHSAMASNIGLRREGDICPLKAPARAADLRPVGVRRFS